MKLKRIDGKQQTGQKETNIDNANVLRKIKEGKGVGRCKINEFILENRLR